MTGQKSDRQPTSLVDRHDSQWRNHGSMGCRAWCCRFGAGGGDAAAVSQQQLDSSLGRQGFELSKSWPCLTSGRKCKHRSRIYIYQCIYEDKKMLRVHVLGLSNTPKIEHSSTSTSTRARPRALQHSTRCTRARARALQHEHEVYSSTRTRSAGNQQSCEPS